MSVFPPVTSGFRQNAAHPLVAAELPIATGGWNRKHECDRSASPHPGAGGQVCYPSPTDRSGVSTAGPDFVDGQGLANGVNGGIFPFSPALDGLSSGVIITLNRGSTTCSRNRFSRSPFWPAPSRAACPPRKAAASLAPLSVRPLPMPQMKIWSPVRRLVRWLVLPLAASNWACRPAIDLTHTAAPRRGPVLTPRPSRASARGGLFACQSAPARAD